jgi:hypothetical protein
MNDLVGKIITAILTLIGALIVQRLAARPKLVVWRPQPTFFQIPGPTPPNALAGEGQAPAQLSPTNSWLLYVVTTAVQNIGPREATNIQLLFVARPMNFRLEPPLRFTETVLPSGEYMVEIPSLAPHEWVTVNVLHGGFALQPVYIRSDQGQAAEIPLRLNREFPTWASAIAWLLLFLGSGTLIYWLAVLVRWLISLWKLTAPAI